MGDGHLDPGQLITAETTEAAPDECDEVQRMSLTPGDTPVYGAQQAQHQLPPSSNGVVQLSDMIELQAESLSSVFPVLL
jgi:hypothetical protein